MNIVTAQQGMLFASLALEQSLEEGYISFSVNRTGLTPPPSPR